MSDMQLNIVVPKKTQSSPNAAMNSRQKHFEKFMTRKQKKMEKSSSILRPKISKDHQSDTNPYVDTANTFKRPQTNTNYQTKSILKKAYHKEPIKNNETSKNPEAIEEEPMNQEQEPEKVSYPTIFTTIDFSSLPINDHLKKALQSHNYHQMTNIQQIAIPSLLTKSNSVVKSETGSGKTLCYLVPIYDFLMKRAEKVSRAHGTLALIICPTRELCIQVDEEARKLSKAAIWVVNGAIMGGEAIKKEKARLRKGINILISTPGRLVYHLQNSQSFLVQNLEFLVLEESDRTLDMGFTRDIESIIDMLSKRTPNWDKVQKILISANFSQKIKTLTLKMSSKELKYIGWESKMEENKEQEFFETEEMLKIPKSIKQEYMVLKEDQKNAFLINILRRAKTGSQKIMIFVATIDETEFLSHLFTLLADIAEKFKIYKLHGDIDQKTRTSTYMDFKKNTSGFSVLIATDVASRGLDLNCVDITILTSIPPRPIDYCNAIGRTGRIDKPGLSILMLYEEELGYLEELRKSGIEEVSKHNKVKLFLDRFEGIRREVVGIVRNDREVKTMAKRAYVSFMRAYNRNQKGRFFLKGLNLEGLARSFGIEGGKYSQDEEYKEGIIKRKDKFNEKVHERYVKKNVIQNVRDLERMEFG